MEYRILGNTDLQVSSIGLGCVTFGREIDEPAAFEVMDRAVERGINLFDTAEAYAAGASEAVIGRWLASRGGRDKLVLATKVTGPLTRERILSSAEESLRRLQTDRIDLFQLHHWNREAPLAETLEALDELVQQGKVRYIGCSNYSADNLREALEIQTAQDWATMASVQPHYNLVARQIEEDLVPLCQERQVGVLSYSPLGAGFLTGKYTREKLIPAGTRFDVIPAHQDIYFTEENFRILDRLRAEAKASGISMIQLALGWALNQPGITSVLIGARKLSHVDQAFEAEARELNLELLARLTSL